MSNLLLVFWQRLFGPEEEAPPRRTSSSALSEVSLPQASATVFLVLRRMRAPLIALILIFAVSVLGLTLIPGEDAQGDPRRLNFFESFYFMLSTATTIGFGEVPYPLTAEQRMWVTGSIFLAVIGWAYAIGSLLALLQDRGFRRALALQHFMRKVARLREPFLLVVGHGNTGRRLTRSLDTIGRRSVVLDDDESHVSALELGSYRADTPALVADGRDTSRLRVAGLGHRYCEGVLALTGDEEANLAVAMAVALLRPDLPVIARASSRPVAERMRTFGNVDVVNPFDRFGDHLRILLRSPSSYQLMIWLTSAPGTKIPRRYDPIPQGRWVVSGYGRFGHEITADLRAEGVDVTVIERKEYAETEHKEYAETADGRAAGEGSPVLAAVPGAVEHAVGFVAATDSDTANLSLVEAARRANPDLFIVARQNRATNAALYRAIGVDFVLVQAEVIAHETLARLANPALMRFLPQVPRLGEAWSATLVEKLLQRCGPRMQDMWRVRLTAEDAPALSGWLESGEARLGDLVRSPWDRERPIDAVPLLVLRDGESSLGPDDDFLLEPGDELLLVGRSSARRALDATLVDEATMAYVVGGRFVPSSWIWRRLAGQGSGRSGRDG